MKTYEIQIGDAWERVKGTTSGLREGWLSWKDSDGAQGLARPGTWRPLPKKVKGKSYLFFAPAKDGSIRLL